MSEPAGNGPVEAGEANLGGIATTLLGIFMMLTASLGALWIAVLILSGDRETSMHGQLFLLLFGPKLAVGFLAGRFYRRAGRHACDAGQRTTDLWRAGLASLVIAVLMGIALNTRVDFFWEGLPHELLPVRHVILAVFALHGLFVGVFGRPRDPANA